jgi:hypothetical protein
VRGKEGAGREGKVRATGAQGRSRIVPNSPKLRNTPNKVTLEFHAPGIVRYPYYYITLQRYLSSPSHPHVRIQRELKWDLPLITIIAAANHCSVIPFPVLPSFGMPSYYAFLAAIWTIWTQEKIISCCTEYEDIFVAPCGTFR